MGNFFSPEKTRYGGLLGKIAALLNEKLQHVEWGEFRLDDLFESSNGNFDIQKSHINSKGDYVITAGVNNYGILGKTDVKADIFDPNTITIDMFGNAFYRQFKYKMVTHARVFSLKPKFFMSSNVGLFLVNSFHFLNTKYGYGDMCSWEKIKNDKIQLPLKDNQIDFEFMESFITDIENEKRIKLKKYLSVTGLKDYKLTSEERNILDEYDSFDWKTYNLKKLYGSSTRGKRLKSDDRIAGELPFVTAGEANEGVSAFIGNNVTVFPRNTTTIDMFGSAKYRNYEYGADDHVAIVHTEKLPKNAAIFVTTAIHKSAHNGQFDYSKNFYATDADELNISLLENNGLPDYKRMETFISAIHKLVIKDVVLYADKK